MINRVCAFLFVGMLCMSVICAIPSQRAFAHNFSGDESASFIAKVQELKVETHLIQQNLSNQTLVAWHSDKITEFWNVNDTKEMTERNKRLGTDIPALISNITTGANSPIPDAAKIGQFITLLDNDLAEGVTVRVDSAARNNATVGALAIANVLDETLEDYGKAWAVEDEEGGASMNETMTSANNSSETKTSATGNESAPTDIVNVAAYQTAQGLARAAQTMFNDLKTKAPSNATESIAMLDQSFTDLKKLIDNKAPNDDVAGIVHGPIMTNLQTAFNLQAIPEFPLPLLLTIPPIVGIILAIRTRLFRSN